MRKILTCLLIVSLSVSIFTVSGNAQKNIKKEEIITNATIVKMVKAKLGDTIILSKIKSGKTDFDLSTDAIVKLKELRVSDKVIEAMMGAESDSPPQTPAVTVATPSKVESVSPPQTQEVTVATPPRVENVLPPQTQKATSQIKTDKDNYNYGETIKVSFFDAPGDKRDWICIVPVGSPDNEAGDYKNMPQGVNQGIITFDSPASGKYEVRAYYNYSTNGYVVSSRYGFSVGGSITSGSASSSRSQESSPSQERIIVPGGLKNGKLNNLWKVAKNKCFEMNFVVSNEDKETGNLFCTMQTDGAPRTIKINFNEKGFSIETRGPFGNSFLTRFDKYPALHKSEMEKTLKQAAGIKD